MTKKYTNLNKNIKAKNIKAKNIKAKNIKAKGTKSKSCPVGKLCINTTHILILLIIIALILFICYLKKNTNNKNDTADTFTNQNNNNQNNNNQNNKDNNDSKIRISGENIELNKEDNNITINYHTQKDPQHILINKDHERLINPLEPPERRNFHLNPSGLEVVHTPGIPINVPTRGYSGGMVQVGVLHKDSTTDRTNQIGQNMEPVILPLFGRPTHNGSNKWSYYTATDKNNQVKLPLSNKNRVCNAEQGCDELYDNDSVTVPAYNGDFKVSIYEFDKPRYIPYV